MLKWAEVDCLWIACAHTEKEGQTQPRDQGFKVKRHHRFNMLKFPYRADLCLSCQDETLSDVHSIDICGRVDAPTLQHQSDVRHHYSWAQSWAQMWEILPVPRSCVEEKASQRSCKHSFLADAPAACWCEIWSSPCRSIGCHLRPFIFSWSHQPELIKAVPPAFLLE